MRKRRVLLPLFTLFMLLVATVSFAQHTVVPWRDNKAGTVSLTFDDGQ
jgi:hypothetical protein